MPLRRVPRPARVLSAWSLAGCLALTLAAAAVPARASTAAGHRGVPGPVYYPCPRGT